MPATVRPFTPSHYQQAIFDFVHIGTGHGVVQATAGSGKTTTLVEIARRLPRNLDVCFLAFNRHSTAELAEKLPPYIRAKTVHALGRQTLLKALATKEAAQLIPQKYRTLVKEELTRVREEWVVSKGVLAQCENYLMELLHFARVNVVDTKRPEEVKKLALRYNLRPPDDPNLEEELQHAVRRLLRKGVAAVINRGIFDFDDMIYVPLVCKLPPPQFDFVFVDEAQDLSVMQLEFTLRLVRQGGRQLYVGDPRQAIYGFAGADTDAMTRIVRRTGAKVLPLSVTYRCPKSHVALAKELAPEIEAAPQAIEGNVHLIRDSCLRDWVQAGDLILCRNNAPLVRCCLQLIREGKPAVVQGRDIARQIIDLATRIYAKGLDGWEGKLEAYEFIEEERLHQRILDTDAAARLVARMLDLVDCLRHLTKDAVEHGVMDVAALCERVQGIFSDIDRPITLSTVHKAKGREADRVFLLYPELMPAVYARTAEARRGEDCVLFVALTRAKRDLIFVERAAEA